MCWSLEASTAVAAAGFVAAGYAAHQDDPPAIYLPLGYFALMETLQAVTYLYIDDCELPGNQLATILGYLHIAFQPFFINMIGLFFLPPALRQRLVFPVYLLCFATTILTLIQLYPFDWAGACEAGRPLCGVPLCSVSGEWHIAWQIPVNGIGNGLRDVPFLESGFPGYVLMSMAAPFVYGSWRFGLFHYITGPAAARLLTDNINEWPAIWCLLSVGLLVIAVESPVRRLLHVRSWYGLGANARAPRE